MKRLTAVIVAVLLGLTLTGTANAQEEPVRLRIHTHAGQWAYEKPDHPHDILAPRGTNAAHKIRHARPGDVLRFAGAQHGRFQVIGVIDIQKAADPWDRSLHIIGTARYVYLDRL